MDETEDRDRIMGHVAQLMEHYDHVQIFITTNDRSDEGPVTKSMALGGGNIHARQGQVREWLIQQDHRARLYIEEQDMSAESDEG